MKIWEKGYTLDKEVEDFTVADDYLLDRELIAFDCIASKAHAKMLCSIEIISKDELDALMSGLDEIMTLVARGEFKILKEDEDCHTAIEKYLIERCGEAGEKIHTGRSRNDQVLTAMRLYEKNALGNIKESISSVVQSLELVTEKYGEVELPGFTHMQKAMPSSIALWAHSFVDAFTDQITMIDSVCALIDQSPLGTAVGFGIPGLNLDRKQTAEIMGFTRIQENPIYAQFSRGKFEGEILNSCSQTMLILNRLASDLIMFGMAEFGFIKLPKEFCTGSSIMPQKVNPDVLELVRAKYHSVLAEEFKVKSTIANLISGYNRDVQLTKKSVIEAIAMTIGSLSIMAKLMGGVEVDEKACREAMTQDLYATEKVYDLVKQGMPFRKAYRKVAKEFVK